jgi:predicted amidohydrolase
MENMNSLLIYIFCNFSNNLKGHKFGQGLLSKTLSQKLKTFTRLKFPKLKIQVKMFKLISLHFFMLVGMHSNIRTITTLTLNSRPKQRLTKVRAKNEAKSHISCFKSARKCEGMNPYTLK